MTDPAALVTVAGGGRRRGDPGRYHLDPACPAITEPKRRQRVPLADAVAARRRLCPYCAPLPPCCATGSHAGTVIVPAVPILPRDDEEPVLLLDDPAAEALTPGEDA